MNATSETTRLNPYDAPIEAQLAARRQSSICQLPKRYVLGGLCIPPIIFGCCAAFMVAAMSVGAEHFEFLERLAGPVSSYEIVTIAAAYSGLAFAVTLLAVPSLLLMNGRGALGPRQAFSTILVLHSVAIALIASNEWRSGIEIGKMLVIGWIFGIPTIIAARGYATWVRRVTYHYPSWSVQGTAGGRNEFD